MSIYSCCATSASATTEIKNSFYMKQLLCVLLLACSTAATCYAQTSAYDALFSKGIGLYNTGDFKGALKQYQQALQLDKRNPELNYEFAITYFALNDMPNTIRYSDAVIKSAGAYPELKAQALVTKGSALDVTGEPGQAMKAYQKALKLDPRCQLAYYNIGLTLFNQKKHKEAEEALVKAVQLKPRHSSSHLLLGYIKQAQQRRVQSLLAFYNFLLLEPASERATTAFKTMQQLQQEGMSKGDGNSLNILVSADKMEDNPFSAAELMLSMMQAANTVEAQEGKTPEQLFFKNTEMLFNTLGELRKDREDFWWSYYVEFFHEMALNKNVEAFSYHIGQSEASKTWVKEHPDEVDQLTRWHGNYKR